jgi:hypothetical protein
MLNLRRPRIDSTHGCSLLLMASRFLPFMIGRVSFACGAASTAVITSGWAAALALARQGGDAPEAWRAGTLLLLAGTMVRAPAVRAGQQAAADNLGSLPAESPVTARRRRRIP